MIAYNRVLERLRKCRRNQRRPNAWYACCPIHKSGMERRASLSAWLYGQVFLCKCNACGATTKQVIEALGFTMKELCEPKDRGARSSAPEAEMDYSKRKIVAEYIYRSANGNVLYKVCRWEPKAFHQERFDIFGDNSATGSWKPGLGTVERVLYRLPELLAKPKHPVIIVEGEKDADRLASLGLLATTNVGGVGMGWHDDYSIALCGRRVAIIPDNDPPGLRHAYHVAGSLLAYHAASVRIVHLPNGYKDVSDYLDKDNDLNSLLVLIKEKIEYTPSDNDFEGTKAYLGYPYGPYAKHYQAKEGPSK